ncbi:MAG: hypothetical protein ABL958_13200 [Bdellovibrionia bacterium]
MNKLIRYLLIPIATSAFGWACWATYYQSDFMNASKAEKKWGVTTLDVDQFKAADLSKRAPMAVDIIKRNAFVGKNMKLVREELGDPDSYFFSDTIYAYKIMPFPGENKENWHLVFIPDEKLEKVKEVKIHKKCCYKSPL